MSSYILKTTSPEQTVEIGESLARLLKPGDTLTLAGDLGAGKTTFTKGLAKGLGVRDMVSSPTFTIIKEYQGRLPLYHMDVYRMDGDDEDLGFDEYFASDGVTVVEWADNIASYLPNDRLEIEILREENESERTIQLTPIGNRFLELVKEFET